jgi:phosphoglycerate dehydrogenase-like enzyme
MAERLKILVNAEMHPDGLRVLEDAGHTPVVVPESDPGASHAAVPACAGMVANASLKLGEEFFAKAPLLRVVGRMGVGYDNVDVEAARRRGIRVVNTPLPVIEPVAEHTILLMIAVARRLIPGDRAVREGRWREPGNIPGAELRGKTLGLVGMGNTGRRVAEIAVRGFEMKAVYFDRLERPDAEKELGARRLSLEETLAASDFVSVHVNLSPETRGLIGAKAFSLMKKGAVLINLSRGPVVDEAALVAALQSGHLGGAGLDVFEAEPPAKDHPLFKLPNVVLTPHIGGASAESKRGCSMVALDIVRVLCGDQPVHGVV